MVALGLLGALGLTAVTGQAPATAVECEGCEGPGGPGAGEGGGGNPSIVPVRVSGTFTYADTTAGGTIQRPIAFARVEVWRFAPRETGVWTWANDATLTTDANGAVATTFPFGQAGILYELRVFATNYAAIAVQDVSPPFHASPGEPGPVLRQSPAGPGETLSFSWAFTDPVAPALFNLAETVRRGFDFAAARRDPAETDPIGPATVVWSTVPVPGTYYNPGADAVVVFSDGLFTDGLILHEYAHFLEEQIGSFPWIPTVHNGCIATDVRPVANSPEHAWMEGFGSWFAQAVMLNDPGARLFGNTTIALTGTITPGVLEAPGCTGLPAWSTGDFVESFVAGALYDLTDLATDPGSRTESWDTLARLDTPIFQIMDRELDIPPGGGRWPDINGFRTAWRARGLPAAELDAVLAGVGVPVPAPPPVGGTTTPPPLPDPRVCLRKPWTPGC